MAWNIGSSWPGDALITRNTSAVAFSRSSASSRSRVRRATFVSSRAADELRGRTAFGAMRALRAAAFGACALRDLPPALDRRRIAAPRLRTGHLALNLAHMEGPGPMVHEVVIKPLGAAGRHGPCPASNGGIQ